MGIQTTFGSIYGVNSMASGEGGLLLGLGSVVCFWFLIAMGWWRCLGTVMGTPVPQTNAWASFLRVSFEGWFFQGNEKDWPDILVLA